MLNFPLPSSSVALGHSREAGNAYLLAIPRELRPEQQLIRVLAVVFNILSVLMLIIDSWPN